MFVSVRFRAPKVRSAEFTWDTSIAACVWPRMTDISLNYLTCVGEKGMAVSWSKPSCAYPERAGAAPGQCYGRGKQLRPIVTRVLILNMYRVKRLVF